MSRGTCDSCASMMPLFQFSLTLAGDMYFSRPLPTTLKNTHNEVAEFIVDATKNPSRYELPQPPAMTACFPPS
jgi:hypothetical protein